MPDPDLSPPAGHDSSDQSIPRIVAERAAGRSVELVWRNEGGGLTFCGRTPAAAFRRAALRVLVEPVQRRRSGAARLASMTPRIPPLQSAEVDERQRLLLDTVNAPATTASNIFTTLVRHPGLFRKWLPFGGKLLAGRLPARDRELLILRTGWLCTAEYEWAQHVPIGKLAGLSDEEVAAVQAGPNADVWSPFDAALLRAADELHAEALIGDSTWATLAAHYTDEQLIEVPMVVGHYHLVAFTLNSLGVPLEEGVPGFEA